MNNCPYCKAEKFGIGVSLKCGSYISEHEEHRTELCYNRQLEQLEADLKEFAYDAGYNDGCAGNPNRATYESQHAMDMYVCGYQAGQMDKETCQILRRMRETA